MLARKLSLLWIPLGLVLAASPPPGRAQQSPFDPMAFADTTLLRDTLGLRFDRLFQMADSLRMLPDSLRAISIRYQLGLTRLLTLADSMHVPVDSVGPVLERERFNPLASATTAANDLAYNTTYTLQQTRSSWINGSDYNLSHGPLFLRNVATIQQDRFETGNRTTQRQTRNATTELGWRITPDYSVGGRAVLGRFDSNDPSSGSIGETRDEYQLSVRTRQRPTPGLSSELNLFSGLLDLESSRQEKHGLTTDFNGRMRHESGDWYVHELSGQLTGNVARTRVVRTQQQEDARDVIGGLTGTLNLFEARRLGFNGTYALQKSQVRTPDDAGTITDLTTSGFNLDATLRANIGAGGYASLTERLATSDQVSALSGPSSRRTHGISADARYALGGWALESRFLVDLTRSEVPQADSTGGYGEDVTNRSLEGTMTRRLFARLNARVNARIGLTRYRYHVIGNYGTPPVSRDHAQQSYRIEGTYTFSQDFNSGLNLEVGRLQFVNIPGASTGANYTLRTYRGEWRWTYRLLRGLTATQRNTVSANYTAYSFLSQNDRLGLDYATTTTLNAVLNPRLSLDLIHFGQVQPSGNYTRQPDGLYYFTPADQSRSFSLTSRLQYTPAPGLSLTIEPSYQATGRDANTSGVEVPQRDSRTLNFQGSANLNLPVGRTGRLSGSFGRTYFGTRTISYTSGVPQPSPRSESDYWISSLQFSWRM